MLTTAQLIDRFLGDARVQVRIGDISPATLRWYTDQFSHLQPLRKKVAEQLRIADLEHVPVTNAVARALKRLFKWGLEEGEIGKNPFWKLKVPPCGKRERVLSRDEIRRLYLAAPRCFRRMLFTMLHTLARPGEIARLTWKQINWRARVIELEEFKSKKQRRDGVKVRCIPLPKCVLRMLRNLYRKAEDQSPGARVFRSVRGVDWNNNSLRCAMRRARAAAGLWAGDEQIVCYHMRHTAATAAIRADIPLKKLADVMGHTKCTTTERYLHMNTSDLVETVDRVHARPRNRAGSAGKAALAS